MGLLGWYNQWTRVTEHADFPPPYGHGLIVYAGKLWIIGGLNLTPMNDVWCSEDGRNWTLATEHAGFSPRFFHGVAVFHDRLGVIGRYFSYTDNARDLIASGLVNNVWSLTDGVTWKGIHKSAAIAALEICPVVVYDNKWIVGEGRGFSPMLTDKYPSWYLFNTVRSSSDGNNWTIASNDAGVSSRYGQSVVEFNNAIWLTGRYDGSDARGNNDVGSYPSTNETEITHIEFQTSAGPQSPVGTNTVSSVRTREQGAIISWSITGAAFGLVTYHRQKRTP